MPDVIIIGAGIAGLSAGALLAKDGYSVIVLEKSKNIGGRAQVREFQGYLLDFGIHFVRFGRYSRCAEVLKKIGKNINFLHPTPPLFFKNGEFSEFPKISKNIRKKLIRYFLFFPFNIKRFFYDVPVVKILNSLSPTEELKEMMKILLLATLVCPDIEKASAREFRQFLKLLFKAKGETVGYPEGGWRSVFEILKNEILKNGEILLDTEVQKILIEGGRVVKVTTKRGDFSGKSYILTIPPSEIPRIIDINIFSPQIKNYLKNVEPTSGITLYFALKDKISDTKSIIFTDNPLSMGCFISNIEGKLTPPGKQLGVWFCFLEQNELRDKNIVENRLEGLKRKLAEMFKDIWSLKEWEITVFHRIVDAAVPKVGQSFKERIGFSTNIKNLFLAGDATGGSGWGSEISFDSAIKSVELVKKYMKKER